MKKIILAFLMLAFIPAFGQGVRYDLPPILGQSGTPLSNVTVVLCPGTATTSTSGCSPQTQAYTDITNGTACTLGSPVTLPNTNVCRATSDGFGNAGFWLSPGAYIYCLTGSGITTQCYNLTVPVGVSSSGTVASPLDLGSLGNFRFSSDTNVSRIGAGVVGFGTGAQGNAGATTRQAIVQIGGSDTGLSRDSAGVIDVGNGTQGDFSGSVKAFNHIAKGDPNYDVKAFGAKGDGSTDDTTAIQQAINYACTGATTAPASNTCTSWISGTALGGEVYFPAGDYHISAPLIIYGGIRLVGAGKLASKITKNTNTVGTLASITAGSGVGRNATSCSGSPCVDAFNNDAIVQVAYISSGNTDYAYRWTIRDLALYGSGTNGTKYGIYAPRSAQAEMKNLYIFMNCSQGAPANCGSVQGSGFYTEDAWLMRHEGVTVDSSWIGWNHVNDGSGIGSGTSAIFSDDWGVSIGCSGFHFFGLSYSSMLANAVDNYNKKGTDLANTDLTCVPYAFTSVSGLSVNGGGAENLTGGVMYAASSSIVISGGFKTFTQTGYTSAGTLATLFMDQAATVTMNGTNFSAVTSPGNIFNIVLQGGSTLIDNNAVLPTGGNTFISYASSSLKIDTGNSGITLTNGSGTRTSTATTDTFAPQKIASGTAAMTTAAIAAGACGSTVTVSASGVVTTDTIMHSFSAAVTGNPGELIVASWPTANNVNFAYCNPTAGSVTPSAATLNWRVVR